MFPWDSVRIINYNTCVSGTRFAGPLHAINHTVIRLVGCLHLRKGSSSYYHETDAQIHIYVYTSNGLPQLFITCNIVLSHIITVFKSQKSVRLYASINGYRMKVAWPSNTQKHVAFDELGVTLTKENHIPTAFTAVIVQGLSSK